MDHSHEDHLFEDQVPFEDRQQNFWQLLSIQSASFGMPALIFGQQIAKMDGTGSAILSVLIGNLVLWLISMGTVAMAYGSRKNAIQNLETFVGRFGSLFGGLVLMGAFLFWYSLQLRFMLTEANADFGWAGITSPSFDVRLGVVLGLVTALLALGGIKFIKWFSVFSFPILFSFLIYALIMKKHFPSLDGTWKISSLGIGMIIAAALPSRVNFPTFFRHGRSRADNFLALSVLAITYTFIGIVGCLLGVSSSTGMFEFLSSNYFNFGLIFIFLIVSLLNMNMVNIYYASAAWEAIVPKIKGNKKLAIVGMAGTIAFTFFQITPVLLFIENILGSFLASLGAILLMMFLIQRIISHRERKFEKGLAFGCWLVGCLTAVSIQTDIAHELEKPFFEGIGLTFFSGILATTLAAVIVIFCEETIWSAYRCFKKHPNHLT